MSMPYRDPPDGEPSGRMSDVLDLRLREMVRADYNYVVSSWLRSYADAPEFASLARPVYFALYSPVVKDLIERSQIAIATLPEAPDIVLGWLAVEGSTLHYLLTKPRWRRLGIASFLVKDLQGFSAKYTHQFPVGAQRLLSDRWIYEPMGRFKRT